MPEEVTDPNVDSTPEGTEETPAPETKFETVDAAVAELHKVRQEAAARRVEAKQAKDAAARFQAFENVPESDLEILSQILTHISSDDPELQRIGAEAFLAIGNDLLGTKPDDPKETPVPDPTETNDDALTPERVQELINEALAAERATQTKTQEEQSRQAEFDAKVEAAGFKKGTPEYFAAVQATVEHNGNVDKALEVTKNYRQSIIDEYVNGRQNDKGVPAPAAGAGGKAPEQPKNMSEAKAAFKQMIEDRQRQAA